MIVTTSPTESIAYIIGWWQYDFVWAILRDTGLFYIPIIVIFARAIMRLFLSQKVHSSDVIPVK